MDYAIKKVREDGILEDFAPEKITRGIFKAGCLKEAMPSHESSQSLNYQKNSNKLLKKW